METILDFASVFLLKVLLRYSRVLKVESQDRWASWKTGVYQSGGSGILNISFPHTDKELWYFQIFCPEEWNEWKCLDYPCWATPRQILSNASATTSSQFAMMKLSNIGRKVPAFWDLSSEGVNMVITAFLEPDQKTLDEIKERMIRLLDKEL